MTPAEPLERDYSWGFRRYQFLSFMMLGIVNALLVPFFRSRGLTDAEIGWLQFLHLSAATVMPFLWGMLSDGVRDRRMPLALAIAGSTLSFGAFYLCHGFLAFAATMLVFAAFFRGITPMGIAMTFAYAESQGSDYSRIRLFGTAGYVAALLLMVMPLRAQNLDVIFPCFLVFALAAAAGLFGIPKISGEARRRLDWGALRVLAERNFAVCLGCSFVAQAAFAAHYVFFSLYLQQTLGVDKAYITLFWAFGSVFEILMFTQAGRLIGRFGTKPMLVVGLLGITVRLAVYAAFPNVTIIFLVQGLHALTFAAVHSSTVTLVNYTAPTKWRSSAQTIFDGLTTGFGAAVGALAGGFVSQAWGYRVLFGCAAGAALVAAIVFMIFGRSAVLARRSEVVEEPDIADE